MGGGKNYMTHAEMILSAVNEFRKQGVFSFSREDIRSSRGINSEDWLASYSPVFQGMRVDQPGGAPAVGERFRNVFRRVRRGVYVLTDYGISVIELRFDQHATALPENEAIINLANLNPPRVTQPNHPQQTHSYSEKVQKILQDAETYHQAYYKSEIFGKPCLYFHQKSLETRHNPSSVKHLEYVYATLIAWGMNRPGRGGSKMRDFETFFESIKPLNNDILVAQTFDCCNMDDDKWVILEKVFKGIQVMKTKTSLVGNSKVMHHMLPNVIPPIDRKYTLSFLHGNTNIRNDLDYEWQLMKKIITFFFIPVASDKNFHLLAIDWINRTNEFPWDTSELKIIDNIVIGALKK
jgi:hypothetical protein